MRADNSNHSCSGLEKIFSRKGLLYIVLVVILFLVFFHSVFFRGHIFGFRDDGYFYTPLYKHIQDYWDRGELPLWDPCDNMGQPLAAMPTSAVFYPCKVVFFLPHILPLNYFDCFNIYIVMHIAICFIAVYYLLVQWRFSLAARLIGALSYTFSGPILFQYCNVVFLVGAAWFPFVIAFVDRFLRTGSITSFFGIAVSLAMMVLGGDPQLAYVSGLPALGLVFLYWRCGILDHLRNKSICTARLADKIVDNTTDETAIGQSDCSRTDEQGRPGELQARPRWFTLLRACFLIGLAAVFAGLLTAVQILPSAELTKLSDRQTLTEPMSLWSIPAYIAHWGEEKHTPGSDSTKRNDFGRAAPVSRKSQDSQEWNQEEYTPDSDEFGMDNSRDDTSGNAMLRSILAGLLCRNVQTDSHHHAVYQFSITPWALPQLFWSDIGGKFFPRNSYWFSGFPNDRTWSPTLYMGIVTIILAFGILRFRIRKKKQPQRNAISLHQTIRIWGSWTAGLALLAGMGGFCGFWMVRAFLYLCGTDLSLQFNACDPVGSVYWFMNVFLPGFASFRYPAKIYTVGVLAFSVLAALGWDCGRRNHSVRLLLYLFVILTVLGIAWLFYQGSEVFYFNYVVSGSFFGPYEPELAWRVTLFCLTRTLIVLLICYILLFSRKFRRFVLPGLLRRKFSSAKIVTCGIVLLVAFDLLCANRSIVSTVPKNVYRVRLTYLDAIHNLQRTHYPGAVAPPRLFHAVSWIPEEFLSTTSNKRFAERFYWENATFAPKMHLFHQLNSVVSPGTMSYGSYSPVASYFDTFASTSDISDLSAFLDTPYWLLPASCDIPSPMKVAPNAEKVQRLFSTRDTSVKDFASLRLPVDSSFWFLKEKTSRFKIFHNNSDLDDPSLNLIWFLNEMKGKANPLPGEYARFVSYQSQRIEFEVCLTRPGDVLLAEQYDKDWHATIRPVGQAESVPPVPIEIRPCFSFMRRITLPAGTHRIVMEYVPATLYRGAVISAVAWCLMFVFGIFVVLSRRKKSGL